jgi:hypothetical protein
MAASQYLATQIVNWIRGTAMPTESSTRYIGLFTAGGTELSGLGYTRVAVDAWGSISEAGGEVTVANAQAEVSPEATSDWATVTQFRIYDAATSGNALSSLTALTTPRTVLSGGVAEFAAGDFTFTISTTELGSYLANQIVEWLTGVAFPTAPATCYAGWYSSVPTEISGSGYARGAITWGSAEDITTAMRVRNSAAVVSGEASATWTATPNYAVHDASSAGNRISAIEAMTESITVGEGGFARVATNGVSFQMSYAA